jgi:hypothetical protein
MLKVMKNKKITHYQSSFILIILIIIALIVTGCSPDEKELLDQLSRDLRDAIADEVGEISKTAVSNAEEVAKTQAAALQATAKAGLATQASEIAANLATKPPEPWDTTWLPADHEVVIANINAIIIGTGLENMGASILQNALAYGVNPAFALAMFRKEASFAKLGTISFANKNPGNIIATGACRGLTAGSSCSGNYGEISTNGRFGIYGTMQDGIEAYFMLLNREYQPGSRYNCSDITCIINIYAPPSENDSGLYIQQISSWTKDYQQRILGQ